MTRGQIQIPSVLVALSLIVSVVAALALPSLANASPSDIHPIGHCKPAISANHGSVEVGFARPLDRVQTQGTVAVHVVLVDFPDAVASIAARDYFKQSVLPALDDIEHLSYGKLDVDVNSTSEWVRMPKASTSYAYGRGTSGADHLTFIQDAVTQANVSEDFSKTDLVIVAMPPTVADPRFNSSAALMGTHWFSVVADGNHIRNAVTVGTDWPGHRSRVVAHEALHSLGLVDLYASSPPSPELGNRFVGDFSLMGNVAGGNSELFGWERWVLGWLDDTQAVCLGSGTHDLSLDSIALRDGSDRLAVLPLGGTKYLALEARTKAGLDSNGMEGVLPYVVDPSIPTGSGPIRVPATGPRSVMRPLIPGQTTVVEGIGVEVLNRTGDSFSVRAHTSLPTPTLPSQVYAPAISRQLGTVTVSWQPPLRDGWTAITGYEYRIGSGRWVRTTETRVVMRGAKRGQVFTVEVRAVNAVGLGPIARLTLRIR